MDKTQLGKLLPALHPIGAELKQNSYRIKAVSNKRITVERVATGSTVNVSLNMLYKTMVRLEAGEFIPARTISYTVTVEYTITLTLWLMGALEHVHIDGVKGYSLREGFDSSEWCF